MIRHSTGPDIRSSPCQRYSIAGNLTYTLEHNWDRPCRKHTFIRSLWANLNEEMLNTVDAFITHAFSVFMGFFAIMNPIANTPVFLGLTAGDDPAARRKIAAKALILSFLIITVFSASGKLIFELFGITLPAFRIMGGTLVALVGYHMLHGGEHSTVQQPSEEDKQRSLDAELEVAITPLAMPILAGPGTIATAMNFASAGGVSEFFVTVGAFSVLCVISYAFFISGERFVQYIGHNGIKVVTRLMGLILAVIGVQMLLRGVGGAVIEFQKMGIG